MSRMPDSTQSQITFCRPQRAFPSAYTRDGAARFRLRICRDRLCDRDPCPRARTGRRPGFRLRGDPMSRLSAFADARQVLVNQRLTGKVMRCKRICRQSLDISRRRVRSDKPTQVIVFNEIIRNVNSDLRTGTALAVMKPRKKARRVSRRSVHRLVKTFTETVVRLGHDFVRVRLFLEEQTVHRRSLNETDITAMSILTAPQASNR